MDDVELLDAGEGRRLERFGTRTVDRPAPTATGWKAAPPDVWRAPDLRFDPQLGWTGPEGDPWPAVIDALTMELRPTSFGGLGLYPEHRANLPWLERQIGQRIDEGREASVLNLFAHTGLVTLAAARTGASVAHVDGARGVVAWARGNAELNGLGDRPIRWLVDDAAAFVAREARRKRRYDGIVLDPPSFGHGAGRRWKLADELPALLDACAKVAADDAFVLLTAHTAGLDGPTLADMVRAAFPGSDARIEGSVLDLDAASGVRLDLGWSIRLYY